MQSQSGPTVGRAGLSHFLSHLQEQKFASKMGSAGSVQEFSSLSQMQEHVLGSKIGYMWFQQVFFCLIQSQEHFLGL
jgi:hypothetical protein